MHNGVSLLPFAALVMAMFLWASSFPVLKYTVMVMDPMVVMFFRLLTGALAFAVVGWRFRQAFRGYRPGDWKWLMVMACCEPGLYFVCEAYALKLTSASQAGVITATLPLMVAVGASLFLGERVRLRTWAGFAVAMGGVAVLSLAGSATEDAPNPILGNVLECMAMGCATAYMIILKRLSSRYSPWFLTAVQSVVGCAFFAPLALFFSGAAVPEGVGPLPAAAILYLGVVVTVGAYGCYNYGMSKVPANQASAFVNLIPVFAMFMGWLFLGERLTSVQFLGAGLILCGVSLSQSRRRGRPEPAVGQV